MKSKISVIIPLHNVEKELAALAIDCLEMAGDMASGCEIILVDDASSDATCDIAENLSLEYPQIKVLSQWQSGGTAAAVLKGLQQADGNLLYVYYVSSGHAFPQISLYYEAMSFTDAVLGYFANDTKRFLGMAMFKRRIFQTLGDRVTHPEELVSLMKKSQIRYLELRYEAESELSSDNAHQIKKPVFGGRVSRPATFTS
jgi:Glycosyltransferases involved in cell wall biogenesis